MPQEVSRKSPFAKPPRRRKTFWEHKLDESSTSAHYLTKYLINGYNDRLKQFEEKNAADNNKKFADSRKTTSSLKHDSDETITSSSETVEAHDPFQNSGRINFSEGKGILEMSVLSADCNVGKCESALAVCVDGISSAPNHELKHGNVDNILPVTIPHRPDNLRPSSANRACRGKRNDHLRVTERRLALMGGDASEILDRLQKHSPRNRTIPLNSNSSHSSMLYLNTPQKRTIVSTDQLLYDKDKHRESVQKQLELAQNFQMVNSKPRKLSVDSWGDWFWSPVFVEAVDEMKHEDTLSEEISLLLTAVSEVLHFE